LRSKRQLNEKKYSIRIASIIFSPSEVNSAPSLPDKIFLELYLEIIPEINVHAEMLVENFSNISIGKRNLSSSRDGNKRDFSHRHIS